MVHWFIVLGCRSRPKGMRSWSRFMIPERPSSLQLKSSLICCSRIGPRYEDLWVRLLSVHVLGLGLPCRHGVTGNEWRRAVSSCSAGSAAAGGGFGGYKSVGRGWGAAAVRTP